MNNEPAKKPASGWEDFLHWVYCPDKPGKCKCNRPEVVVRKPA